MRSLVISIFLSWTLTAELEKRTQAFEMRCDRNLLTILYKDHITNQEVCRKIQADIGEYCELQIMVKKQKIKVVWSCLNVSRFSKDNSTGHSKWKKKQR